MRRLHVHSVFPPHHHMLLLLSGNVSAGASNAYWYLKRLNMFFMHQQFPLEWEWWLANVVASVAMASLGEYICSRHEMEDIPLYTPS